MIKDIFTKEALLIQAEKLKSNNFKPGFDKMSADAAVIQMQLNGNIICKKILAGKYEPMPVMSFRIAKRNGNSRILSKLTATDTVIQKVILEGIYDTVDKKISPNSFAYRKNRGINDALELYKSLASANKYVAKIDPAECFDNINHEILNSQIEKFIDDKKLVSLIMRFVNAPVAVDGAVIQNEKGIAQGAPVSPLLCNIYLSPVDELIKSRNLDFIRYADDVVIFSDSFDELEKCIGDVIKCLETELKLTLNKDKFKITSPVDLEFLGHKFSQTRFGIAVDEKSANVRCVKEWTGEVPANNKRTIDIVSDGILSQKDFSLVFDSGETKTHIPVKETDVINIYSNVVFDSGAMKKAFSNGVTINVFSEKGAYLGRFVPSSPLKSPPVTFEQLRVYYDSDKRLDLAKKFVLASFHNTRLVVRYFNKHNPSEIYERALNKINNTCADIKSVTEYEKLLLLEAKGREAYYSCFDTFVDGSDFRFEKRSRRPPENEFNAMISFGNTLLYNYIATEINKTPLDVRAGFLHSTNKRSESLNLDIAELFKPLVVDRTVFSLINKREISFEDFGKEKDGVYLNESGKRIFIKKFNAKLDTSLQIKECSLSYRSIINEEIRKLIRCFRNGEEYRAFKQVR